MQNQENIIDRIVIYKINPNEQELNGDVILDRNVDGRIFTNCRLTIINEIAVLKNNNSNIVVGVFSLNHYYFLGD